jgi:hypothetical protein
MEQMNKIEFKGELSESCKRFLIKKQIKIQAIASLFATALFLPIIVLGAFLWNEIFIIAGSPLILIVIFSMLPPGKNAQKLFVPKCIYFDLEEGTVVHQCEKKERFHMISSINKIIDCGEWYYLTFNFSDRDLYFVCQKSLLTKGSLEDFEALFEGKIERRIK